MQREGIKQGKSARFGKICRTINLDLWLSSDRKNLGNFRYKEGSPAPLFLEEKIPKVENGFFNTSQ